MTSRPGVVVPPQVSTAQRRVLEAVARRGQASVVDIATELDITTSGARQHLDVLVDLELVETGLALRVPGQRGRSEQMYWVAQSAVSVFPRAYAELTNQLLHHLPAEAVDTAFERRAADRVKAAHKRLVTKRSFAAKLTELAKILDEDGYMASVEPIGRDAYRVIERNCAIFGVAGEHPKACSTELDFLRAALPQAQIDRVAHIMAGALSCSYEVRKRAGGGS